ncbi:hypothetical protein IJT93_11320 [bacterium]|nr:hypothetical protein [bacterium]
MGRFSLRPIHLAVVLALVAHLAFIGGLLAYAKKHAGNEEDKLRIVSTVELVDSIQLPPRPRPVIKTPKKSSSSMAVNPTVFTSNPGKPGKPGKPGWAGPPTDSKKPGASGKPGWSGRSGLKTAIDPDMPKLGVGAFGEAGYPTGHGYGKDGDKFGKHSGFGPDGEGGEGGAGGWGEGGEGGEGGGMLIANLIAVLNSDYSVTLYNDSIASENSFDALGMKRLGKNPSYPYFQIGLAHQFSLTAVNNTKEAIDFYADGNPYGRAGENMSFPPDYYTGQGKIWSPYLWRDLRPGEHRYVDGLSLGGYMKFHFIGANTDSTFMLMVH